MPSELAQRVIADIERKISDYMAVKYNLADPNTKLTPELQEVMDADLRTVMTNVLAEAGIHDEIRVISYVAVDPDGEEHIHQSIDFVNGLTNPNAKTEEKPAEEQYIDGATAAYREWQLADSNKEDRTSCLHGVPYETPCEVCSEEEEYSGHFTPAHLWLDGECEHGNPWDDCEACSKGE